MKLLLTAIALAFASPALAQTGAADPHAGHTMEAKPQSGAQPADPSCPPEHAAMGHCTPKAAAAPAADQHAGHAMKGDGKMACCDKDADGKMACCEKMKAEGKKMECCEKMGGKSADAHAGHSGH
jgi:hypothetical protein